MRGMWDGFKMICQDCIDMGYNQCFCRTSTKRKIEILRRLYCNDCGSEDELKLCEIVTREGLMMEKVLCLDCFLKREKEYAEK